jgi:hypothetical protein
MFFFRGGHVRNVDKSGELQADQIPVRDRASVQRGMAGSHEPLLQVHGKLSGGTKPDIDGKLLP